MDFDNKFFEKMPKMAVFSDKIVRNDLSINYQSILSIYDVPIKNKRVGQILPYPGPLNRGTDPGLNRVKRVIIRAEIPIV